MVRNDGLARSFSFHTAEVGRCLPVCIYKESLDFETSYIPWCRAARNRVYVGRSRSFYLFPVLNKKVDQF